METHIDKLHKSFLLTEEQSKQIYLLKREVVEAHVMVLQHNEKLYEYVTRGLRKTLPARQPYVNHCQSGP
jgi:hypothetical protein